MLEAAHVPVEEYGLALIQVRAGEAFARRRQSHEEQRQLGQHPSEIDVDRTEVDLSLHPERMMLRDHHLDQRHRLPTPDLGHVTTNRGLADIDAVLLDQALPDPTRRVTLLARRHLVGLQPRVDRRLPPVQHWRRANHRLARRRHGRRQRRSHIPAMHMEPIRQRADRQLFALVRRNRTAMDAPVSSGRTPTERVSEKSGGASSGARIG